MADRQRVYEGRPGLAEWGEDLGQLNPRVLRAVRAGVKANVMPASPSGVPFAGLLESTKSLPALPYFLGDLITGGRYGLSESAPQFAVEASGKYDELINKYLAEEGLSESERLPILEKYGLAAGEMLGQLPVPGKMLERMTKTLPKAFKPAGWLAEYFGPTVDPKAVNYAIGTGMGGTLRTAMGEEEPEKFAKGGLGRKPIVRTTAEGVVETAPSTATEIRKEPGGNWLPGSVEKFIDKLREEFVTAGERPVERLRRVEEYIQQNPEMANNPAVTLGRARYAAAVPVDKWLETKLANYIKNDMATERDPVRRGIEQRVAKADETYARGKERIAKSQKKIAEAKARGQDTTAVEDRLAQEVADLEQKYFLDRRAAEAVSTPDRYLTEAITKQRQRDGDPTLAASPEAANWEDVTDYMVEKDRALLYQDEKEWPVGLSGPMPDWIKKVSPNTPIYSLFRGDPGPFAHMRDELVNSLRENSGLPPELRLKPEDLDKMSMDAVAAHVGKIDAWRLRDRMAADLLKSRNAATVTHKEYPGTGLEWKELKMPEPVFEEGHAFGPVSGYPDLVGIIDQRTGQSVVSGATEAEALGLYKREERTKLLQDALEYEGKVMGHCVGGYCPQVASGQKRIFSLRDAKGEPHVTIEVRPGDVGLAMRDLPGERRTALIQQAKKELFGDPQVPLSNLSAADQNKLDALISQAYVKEYGEPSPYINQIKGKGNLKPKDKYIPFVQDFVKSGKWGYISDFENTDLFRFDPKPEFKQALVEAGVEPPKFVTKEQLDALVEWGKSGRLRGEPVPKFADGGAVEKEEYDERAIDEIVEPLRRKLEPFLGEARKVPRRIKQAAADITEIGPIIKRSNELPLKYFDISGEAGGEADAMRHLLFQAQLARKYGETPAKIISTVHEYTTFGQPESQREMDLYNDVLGREIAAKAMSDEDLVRLAEKYVKSGRAKTLPKDQRGGY